MRSRWPLARRRTAASTSPPIAVAASPTSRSCSAAHPMADGGSSPTTRRQSSSLATVSSTRTSTHGRRGRLSIASSLREDDRPHEVVGPFDPLPGLGRELRPGLQDHPQPGDGRLPDEGLPRDRGLRDRGDAERVPGEPIGRRRAAGWPGRARRRAPGPRRRRGSAPRSARSRTGGRGRRESSPTSAHATRAGTEAMRVAHGPSGSTSTRPARTQGRRRGHGASVVEDPAERPEREARVVHVVLEVDGQPLPPFVQLDGREQREHLRRLRREPRAADDRREPRRLSERRSEGGPQRIEHLPSGACVRSPVSRPGAVRPRRRRRTGRRGSPSAAPARRRDHPTCDGAPRRRTPPRAREGPVVSRPAPTVVRGGRRARPHLR